MQMPEIPVGTGQHPITLVVISANNLASSNAFYTSVFNWRLSRMSDELFSASVSSGPAVSLRANVPDGFSSHVPYIHVANVRAALAQVVEHGCHVEREPWSVPMVGTLARFGDENGTLYGLTDATSSQSSSRIPLPFGDNPKPIANTICSLEMYAAGDSGPRFARDVMGWGTTPTMPQFVGFDPGAGIGGVFQAHTPTLPAVAYIYVQDVIATLTAIDAAGGQRLGDAMSMPGMATFGYFRDPSGSTMGLIGP